MTSTGAVARTIRTSLHGRYLVVAPTGSPVDRAPLLVGFHGYAEDAGLHMTRLQAVADAERWLIVSVEALHHFYRGRSQDVVASWMTRQDRELAIADNVAYVSAVLREAAGEPRDDRAVVFAGFSQGVAMAFRAATLGPWPARGVVALGGDVPPELSDEALGKIPAVLLGRGIADQWHAADTFNADTARLARAGVNVTQCLFDGAHEWTPAFTDAAREFLSGLP